MKIVDYLSKYGKTMGYLETIFLKEIFYADYGEAGLDLIEPEVNIDRNDGTSRTWRIDFVVRTTNKRYAIECDGYSYHAGGMVSRERFNELEEKRNEIQNQNYRLIEFSRDQIENQKQDVIYALRRAFTADPDLYNIYLRRTEKEVTPNDVQLEVLSALNRTRRQNHNKGLVVLATGLGKTYLSAFDAKSLQSASVLFVVHMEHILKQAMNSFQNVLPELFRNPKNFGFYTGSQKDIDGKNVIFSTVQTLTRESNLRRLNPNQFDYIVIDETHHVAAPSYEKILNYFNPKFLLGLTATPDRMDGQDILKFYDNNLVYSIDQSEAIRRGYLSPIVYKAFKDDVDYSNIYWNGFRYDYEDLNKSLMIELRDKSVITKFKELASNKRTIGFCVSIEHAEWCAQHFRDHGVDAVAIHSEIKGRQGQEYQSAKDLLDAFSKDRHQVAFVVDMLNEGIDIPDVECLLMLRPTESSTVLTQQIGRGLRISPGKDHLLVLDFIGNYRTAPRVLDGLGVKLTDLKKDTEKEIYYYDNNGKRVEFQEDVVDIFKYIASRSTKKVNTDIISDEWKEYGNYLEENTRTGNGLFWSVGKKNNNMPIQLWALDWLEKNRKYYKTNNDISVALQKESKNRFPDKTLEGIRALFFSKILGLLKSTDPIIYSDAYRAIASENDQKKKYDLVSNQLEKFYFWNDNFSLINRHQEQNAGRIRKVNEVFHLYPVMFVYSILSRLHKNGFGATLTKFEIDNFIVFAHDNHDANDISKRIMLYREYDEKYELEKYIKSKTKSMDTRFYKILQYSKYLSFSPEFVSTLPEYLDEMLKRSERFDYLIQTGKIIKFSQDNPAPYRNMLFSDKDIITYHENL